MPYDGLFIHYLCDELNNTLKGGKINRIIDPSILDIILQIRAKSNNGKIINHDLYISSSLDMPRLYLTTKKTPSVDVPKNFCMVLRKYIERGTIKRIEQFENDRLIKIEIASTSELGDSKDYTLIIELMGRNSNIILINDEGIIIDAMRKLPPTDESTRLVLPHALYRYPDNSTRVNPFILNKEELYNVNNLQGLAKPTINYIQNNNVNIYNFIRANAKPIIFKNNKRYDFYHLPIYDNIEKSTFNSLSEMLDLFYSNYIIIYNDKAKELKKIIKNKIIHLQNKLDNLENDLDNANKNLSYNDLGILLQANLYKVKKGLSSITVENFLNNNESLDINLDPMLDPSHNLAKFFQKAKKAKNGLVMVKLQIDLTKNEINYLDEIYSQIEYANNIDLDEIKEELVKGKYIKKSKQVKPKNKKINITKFILNGNEIYCGKNNIQNDYITHKLANHYDWWFHVKDAPGSHVVFRMPDINYILTEEDIRFCANLASCYSKTSISSSVPVDYLQVKYIKKIPGLKGSQVTYTNQKTIYIDPDIDKIKSSTNQ